MKKISSFLVVLLLMSVSFMANAQEYPRGDVSQDGAVDIADVTDLINYLLTGTWPDEPVTEGDWVDLGLPSGTLWATRNVGADNPEDYGDYFAWGETEPKEVYSWTTYKWAYYDDEGNLCFYDEELTDDSYLGEDLELRRDDDAAYVHYLEEGDNPDYHHARMPSYEQMLELYHNCTWQWTQRNGVNGQLMTGPNGNTMFLPAAGVRMDDLLYNVGSEGCYLSRDRVLELVNNAYALDFLSTFLAPNPDYARFPGYSVRAVREPNK